MGVVAAVGCVALMRISMEAKATAIAVAASMPSRKGRGSSVHIDLTVLLD